MTFHRLCVVLLALGMALLLAACSGDDGGSTGGGGTDYTMYTNEDFAGTWSPFEIEVHGSTYTGTATFNTSGTLVALEIDNVPKVNAEGQLIASAGGDITGEMGIRLEWPYLSTSFSSQFNVTGSFTDKNTMQLDIGGGQVLTMTKN